MSMTPDACALPARLATRPARRRPLISLTPLIDVVFILLVFFMLASSFMDWRAIELSTPGEAGAAPQTEGALLVEVHAGGLRLSGVPLDADRLADRISARLASTPDQRVLVKPAPGVSMQRAVDVLDELAVAGVSRLSLIRDPVR
ncbi:MAG TPA: biopolymer transporter ExbD [Arenicellales bacterium]|nr:biopolymer transporter ExbD [Arenicellales bacterium]